MKATIGVYDTQEHAVNAINQLTAAGVDPKQLSVLGKSDLSDDTKPGEKANVAAAEVGAGMVVGPALGALAGASLLAIPGFGFVYGAGALMGALAGLDIG